MACVPCADLHPIFQFTKAQQVCCLFLLCLAPLCAERICNTMQSAATWVARLPLQLCMQLDPAKVL